MPDAAIRSTPWGLPFSSSLSLPPTGRWGRGLWLSCASTAGIVLFSKPLYQTLEGFCFAGSSGAPKVAGYFLGAAAVSMGAYAFSFPILLAGTGWISLLTPLANVLVAPLSAPALVCGMLCALFPFLPPAAFITNLCINWILSISRLIASIPLFTFSLDEFWKVLWLLLGAAVTALLFRWRADKALRRYGAALLVLAFSLGSITLSFAQRHEVELVALENCSPLVLIRGEKAVVVGTPSPYEIRTLSRYLEFRGVEQLDALIAADCGEQIHSGLLTLVRDFSPGLVAGPDDDYILSMLERRPAGPNGALYRLCPHSGAGRCFYGSCSRHRGGSHPGRASFYPPLRGKVCYNNSGTAGFFRPTFPWDKPRFRGFAESSFR
ncbi:MAG: ComEC/Rec2 family competence protein [Oscillospiraceae bacterium]